MMLTRRSLVGTAALSVAIPASVMAGASAEAGKRKMFALVQDFGEGCGIDVLAVDESKARLEEYLRAYEPRYDAAAAEWEAWEVPGWEERRAALPTIKMPPEPPFSAVALSLPPLRDGASEAERMDYFAAIREARESHPLMPAYRAAEARRDDQRWLTAEEDAAMDRKREELQRKHQICGDVFKGCDTCFKIIRVLMPSLPETASDERAAFR